MAEKEYIERGAFLEQKREQYCKDCARRKGMRNGKYKTLYEIGEAPCRACEIDDVLNDVEGFPAADVRPVVRGKWVEHNYDPEYLSCDFSCSECNVYLEEYYFGEGQWPGKSDHYFCPNCGADMREVG